MSLSIIIPFYNEIDQLKFTLKKLSTLKKKLKIMKLFLLMILVMMTQKNLLRNIQKKILISKFLKIKKKDLGLLLKRV